MVSRWAATALDFQLNATGDGRQNWVLVLFRHLQEIIKRIWFDHYPIKLDFMRKVKGLLLVVGALSSCENYWVRRQIWTLLTFPL